MPGGQSWSEEELHGQHRRGGLPHGGRMRGRHHRAAGLRPGRAERGQGSPGYPAREPVTSVGASFGSDGRRSDAGTVSPLLVLLLVVVVALFLFSAVALSRGGLSRSG